MPVLSTDLLKRGLIHSRMPASAADKAKTYVRRESVETVINSYVDNPNLKAYLVVYGPRGAGKSTTVEHSLRDREGVVYVKVTEALDPAGTFGVLSTALDALALPPARAIAEPKVKNARPRDLERLLEAASKDLGRHATIVLDVNIGTSDRVLYRCATFLKELTHDRAVCRGILILSSSYAVMELPPDRARQEFAHVRPFSAQEARVALDKMLVHKVEATAVRNQIIGLVVNATTFGSDLTKVAGVIPSDDAAASGSEQLDKARAFVTTFEARAHDDVLGVLGAGEVDDKKLRRERGFHVHRLFLDLLRGDEPVKLVATNYLPNPDDFAQKLRKADNCRHALILDLVDGTVQFGTPAHRRAAEAVVRDRAPPDDGF